MASLANLHSWGPSREALNRAREKTCGACKFFTPVTDHRLFDGACHNKRATLGTVIQTSRGSSCNYHEPADVTPTPGQG
jgi:hypothetical protein